MGVTIYRPGQRLYIPGVQVFQQRGASGGWWDNYGAITSCVTAYAPKGAASQAASYTNLAGNATYNAAPGTAPGWNSTDGWVFTFASSHYLRTGVTPGSSRAYTVIVRFSGVPTSGGPSSGAVVGAVASAPNPEIKIAPRYSGSGVRYSNGPLLDVLPVASSGVFAVAGSTTYRNGSSDGTITGTKSGTIPEIYVGCRNFLGSGTDEFITVNVQALAIYSATLTSGEISTLTTAMNAL